jgi:hypothetical protein
VVAEDESDDEEADSKEDSDGGDLSMTRKIVFDITLLSINKSIWNWMLNKNDKWKVTNIIAAITSTKLENQRYLIPSNYLNKHNNYLVLQVQRVKTVKN